MFTTARFWKGVWLLFIASILGWLLFSGTLFLSVIVIIGWYVGTRAIAWIGYYFGEGKWRRDARRWIAKAKYHIREQRLRSQRL